MILEEECVCGARLHVEDDEPRECRKEMRSWRERHQCSGRDPLRGGGMGIGSGGSFEIGFNVDGDVG